ncbi:MAG: ABC transporter permease subunit [Candidatus Vecturithrix sp.]|jgi:sn-glycerol 3-phosphate transport system permease protein|nr:ABC transporter permease subunit [Candidatus Vecturithrix sp.]
MKQSKGFIIFLHIFLSLAVFIIAFPMLFAFIVSTHTFQDVFTYPPKFFPGTNLIENYQKAWHSVNMGRLLFNSAFISVSVALGKIVLSITSAFAFTYFGDFRGKYLFFVIILITHMLPLPIRIVPTFELMKTFGWVDTYYALTIPFFASATGTLLFRQFFLTVPTSLADAARIDGISPIGFLTKILAPLSRTNMTALFMIEFLYMWNQYLWPLIITNSNQMRVVQIGVKMLLASVEQAAEWNVIMAGTLITMIPPLLVLLLLQRSFVKGFAMQQEK